MVKEQQFQIAGLIGVSDGEVINVRFSIKLCSYAWFYVSPLQKKNNQHSILCNSEGKKQIHIQNHSMNCHVSEKPVWMPGQQNTYTSENNLNFEKIYSYRYIHEKLNFRNINI